MNKKAFVNSKKPINMVYAIIGILIFIAVLPSVVPLLITGIGNLSTLFVNNNLPFSGFFASGGILYLLLAAGLFLAVFGLFKMKGGKGGGY